MFDLVGKDIPLQAVRTALTGLNIEIVREDAEGMTLRVPTCKADVTRECDIVEEIMRIYGYNNIDLPHHMKMSVSASPTPQPEAIRPDPPRLKNAVSNYLTDNGFSEIMNNSLTKSEYYDGSTDFDPKHNVAILNPLSKELNVMRQTLLYGGLECIARNLNYKIHDQRLYEFGRTYHRNEVEDDELPVTKRFSEVQHLAVLLTGHLMPETWKQKSPDGDVYHLKAYVTNIMQRMRVNMSRVEVRPTEATYMAEGIDYVMRDSKKIIATLGQLKNDLLRKMDIKQPVYYADLNWDLLLKQYPSKEVQYAEVPKFPEVRRDLALVLDKKVTFAEVERVARTAEKRLLKQVGLFDVYEGKGITEGMKSYAVSFTLQDKDKTMSEQQIESTMAKLQKALEKELGAHIRG